MVVGEGLEESERSPGAVLDAVWSWLTLTGDRRAVTALLVFVGFVIAGPVGHALLGPEGTHLTSQPTAIPLVSALLSGNFLLFSIVVSVNSLYVSQEQSTLGGQYGQVQSIVEFRRSLEDVVDVEHVPAEAEGLVRMVSGDILTRAQQLQRRISWSDYELQEDVDAYVESLADETGEMNDRLQDATDSVQVMLAVMDYNHDRQINDLRHIRTEYSDDLDDDVDDQIGAMLRLLQYFATARGYFKTLYVRREFARLSSNLVFVSVPAIAVLALFLHHLNRLPDNDILTVGVEAIALAPFILVASYVVRVSLISQRTQTAGQFLVSERDRGDIRGIVSEDRRLNIQVDEDDGGSS